MKYRLSVYCRRNGISQNAGIHDEIEANSDQEAKEKLQSSGAKLFRYYDEVYMTFLKFVELENGYEWVEFK